MADAFSIDPESLVEAIHRMADFLSHTESVTAEIDTLISHLHVTWSGEAAAANVEAHRRWSHGEATMREALNLLKSAGGAAHHNYTQAAATNSAMWS